MRMSISTTSGCSAVRGVDGCASVGGLADDLDVGLGVEDDAEAGAHERLVVGDQDADHHGAVSRSGRRARTRVAAARARACLERAAVERDPLAHADQAVPAAVGARVGAAAVVDDLELERARRRSGSTTRACARPACLSAFVSASCTIR